MDDFDRLLYEGAAQLPVDAAPALEPPKPWKGPLDRVCWGLVLITITLNFLGLDWILPAIGTVLLWLGLRPLRRENGGFRFAYVCATLYAVLRFATMLTLATPLDQWLAEVISMEWSTYTETVPFHTVVRIGILQTVLTLAALGLWQGLKAVFRSAGQKPHAGAAGGVAIVVFLLFPLACIGLDGWLSAGVVLVIYVVLLCNLYKLSRSLDEAGYALKPAPIRVSDGKAAACWLGALALGILVLPLCFARLPVPAEPVVSETAGDQTELQEHLADLGFPEEVLAELAPEDLARLEGAYGLTAKNWPPVREKNQAGMPLVSLFEVPVSDPEYGYRMVYLARFVWEDVGRIPYYTEGIAVSADFHDTFAWLTYLDGHLAWTEDGTAYTAPQTSPCRSTRTGDRCTAMCSGLGCRTRPASPCITTPPSPWPTGRSPGCIPMRCPQTGRCGTPPWSTSQCPGTPSTTCICSPAPRRGSTGCMPRIEGNSIAAACAPAQAASLRPARRTLFIGQSCRFLVF